MGWGVWESGGRKHVKWWWWWEDGGGGGGSDDIEPGEYAGMWLFVELRTGGGRNEVQPAFTVTNTTHVCFVYIFIFLLLLLKVLKCMYNVL